MKNEIEIFLDGKLHCIILDNEDAAKTINAIKKIYSNKLIQFNKKENPAYVQENN